MGDRRAAEQFYAIGEQAAQNRGNSAALTQAYQNFISAAYIDPTWGQAHYQVGNNACDLKMAHTAVAAYRRSLECENSDENAARIYCNLAYQLHTIGHTHDAFKAATRSSELDPSLALNWVNLSIIHYTLNDTKAAVECARKANELQPDDPTIMVALAFSLMHDRQFAEGLKYFEERFRYRLHQYLVFPFTRWRGEPNKTIFIAADQGLGDTLSFARFVERAAKKSKYVHLCVQPELMRLFDYAFMHLKNVNLMPLGSPFPAYDHWTTFVSLPFAMGLTDDEIINQPHIVADVPPVRADWLVPDRKFHVGIAWSGSKLNDINHHRSIDLRHFLELARVPGIQLYSLQKDDRRQDLFDTGASAVVRDLAGYISDVSDTVGVMKHLDLVISCESACAHIAALADKPCWVPYSRLGKDFRIGIDGTKAIWTPKHRFFVQTEDNWDQVFRDIVHALGVKAGTHNMSFGRKVPRMTEDA